MKIYTLGTAAGTPLVRSNACTVIETAGQYYMIDAGGPAASLMFRSKLDPGNLRAVFISHLHEDHFGGISSILKNRIKYLEPGAKLLVFLPDLKAAEVFDALLALSHFHCEGRIDFREIKAGTFYEDEHLTVSAFPNKHLAWEGYADPSYGFLFIDKDNEFIYTGDLAADFSDFPAGFCNENRICMTELTHYKVEDAMPVWKNIKLKHLIFTHVSMSNAAKIKALIEEFPYPVSLADDGDCFDFCEDSMSKYP